MTRLSLLTLLVRDYDDALDFFVGTLGFVCTEDTALGSGKRWVRVMACPQADLKSQNTGAQDVRQTELLLARPSNAAQARRIGRQGEDRVMFFLETPRFEVSFARFRARGVRFLERPRREPYGTVAVFEDLYGNRWDLIEPARSVAGRA